MRNYAAHDSHFLLAIAAKQIALVDADELGEFLGKLQQRLRD